jgi:hypothetical protein
MARVNVYIPDALDGLLKLASNRPNLSLVFRRALEQELNVPVSYPDELGTSPRRETPEGLEVTTKSGPKRFKIRRCSRQLRLSHDYAVQCQLEQTHNITDTPVHSHTTMVFGADGLAREVKITWSERGSMSPVILTKVVR